MMSLSRLFCHATNPNFYLKHLYSKPPGLDCQALCKVTTSQLIPEDTVHLSKFFNKLIYFSAQFGLKRYLFPLVFTTFVQFCAQIVVPFKDPIQRPFLKGFLEIFAYMITISQTEIILVIIKRSSATIDYGNNCRQTKTLF